LLLHMMLAGRGLSGSHIAQTKAAVTRDMLTPCIVPQRDLDLVQRLRDLCGQEFLTSVYLTTIVPEASGILAMTGLMLRCCHPAATTKCL
jgi:hypothetical protein